MILLYWYDANNKPVSFNSPNKVRGEIHTFKGLGVNQKSHPILFVP